MVLASVAVDGFLHIQLLMSKKSRALRLLVILPSMLPVRVMVLELAVDAMVQ
ncbi:MAG: hypothetical protein HFG68_01375 [Hungatella sp.]|nr:hypothetical protein [Hungatella sp.]